MLIKNKLLKKFKFEGISIKKTTKILELKLKTREIVTFRKIAHVLKKLFFKMLFQISETC